MNITRKITTFLTAGLVGLVAFVGLGAGVSHAAPVDWMPTDQVVSGRVVDAVTHKALAGKKIVVYSYATGDYKVTRTNKYGRFEFDTLTGDEFAVAMVGDSTHCAGIAAPDFWNRTALDYHFTLHTWATFSARDLGLIGAFTVGSGGCGTIQGQNPFFR
jgi:hypothetical protein